MDGDRLIINPGGRGAGIVALNKATGAVIWQSQNDLAGYSSVLAFDFGGHHIYTVLTASAAIGLDAKDGSLLWRYARWPTGPPTSPRQCMQTDTCFIPTDYDTGCALLKPTAEGGRITASEVYFNRDMQNHYTTSVLVGDSLYGFSGNQPGVLVAMDFKTGKVAVEGSQRGQGQLHLRRWPPVLPGRRRQGRTDRPVAGGLQGDLPV